MATSAKNIFFQFITRELVWGGGYSHFHHYRWGSSSYTNSPVHIMHVCPLTLKNSKFRRQNIFMSESLFVLGVSVNHHSRFFHSCADVTITNEALQFLTHARHSCPFNSKGSLTSHTYMYWDTRHPFIMVIPDSLALKLSLPVFTTVADGNRTKISRMQYLMTSRWCNITAF